MNHYQTKLDAEVRPSPLGCRCDACAFSVEAMIPDPDALWDKRMGCKPRVPGYRCHMSRPCANGYPSVTDTDYCAWWTDPKTLEQPLRRLAESPAVRLITEGEAHNV